MCKPMAVLTSLVAFLIILSGCIQDQTQSTTTTHTSAPTSSTSSSSTSTTTTTNAPATTLVVPVIIPGQDESIECIEPPKPNCECVQWVCHTPTTSTSTTSTTCLKLPDPGYEPQPRYYKIRIKDGRFRPDEVDAFVGDTIIANITNVKGLHKIRETYTNKTITLTPGSNYELIFYAEKEGIYQLTCNPFCEKPMEAKITVEKPYRRVC